MTIRKRRWLTSLLLSMVFGACGVSDLDVEGRDPAAGGSAGKSSTAPEGGDGTGATANGGTGPSSGGNVASGGDPGDPGASGEGGSGAEAGGDGAGTGGTPAAGTGGTGGTPATPACMTGALENVLFCDDFEAPGLPAWTHFASSGSDGETTRVSSPAHLGSGALRSIKSAPGTRDPLFNDTLGQRTTGKLYVRVWMYIPGSVIITNDALANASLLVLGEAPPGDGGVSLSMWSTGLTLTIYDPNHNPTLVQAASFSTMFPRDAWFCARVDVPIGPSVSSMDFRLRIDAQTLTNNEPAKAVDSALSGPYDRLWVGVNYISPAQANPVTIYYDDIAVGTADIPCQ